MTDATLPELAHQIWTWQRETFGDRMSLHGARVKLHDEILETIYAWRHYVARPSEGSTLGPALLSELADVFHMLVQVAALRWGSEALDEIDHPGVSNCAPFLYQLGRVEAWADTAGTPLGLGYAGMMFHEWQLACLSIRALEDMPAAIAVKLAKNKARAWGKPAADGTISHVKGGG